MLVHPLCRLRLCLFKTCRPSVLLPPLGSRSSGRAVAGQGVRSSPCTTISSTAYHDLGQRTAAAKGPRLAVSPKGRSSVPLCLATCFLQLTCYPHKQESPLFSAEQGSGPPFPRAVGIWAALVFLPLSPVVSATQPWPCSVSHYKLC